ncbi:ATPase [Calothrix sp. 336/3]|nr:ATPase [Calothrix sp. 336/3]
MTPSSEWQWANQQYLVGELQRLYSLLESHTGREGSVGGESQRNFAVFDSLPPSLDCLCENLRLSDFERDILLLCAGVELDSRFASLYTEITGNPQQNYPTFSLALAVLPQPEWGAIAPQGALRRWHLLEIGEGNALTSSILRIDESILHYLAGVAHLDPRLAAIATPMKTRELVPSHRQIVEELVKTWSFTSEQEELLPILQLCGHYGSEERAIATACYQKLNFTPYRMTVESLPSDTANLNLVKCLWEREFALNRVGLVLECDNPGSLDAKQQMAIAQFLDSVNAPVIIISSERYPQKHRSLIAFDVHSPTSEEQRLLWHQALNDIGCSISHQEEQVELLVSHFNLTPVAIRAASLKAQAKLQSDSSSFHLWEICRTQARPRLDELAQRMDSTADWDDLVLPEREKNVLRDAAAQLQQRTKVYQTWGFGGKSQRGLGISALFAGASGTGKTMAAEVLAREMRLDLYRIDLSAIVSKYIGETEKNLARVFDAAEAGGVILLFDEADAIFGKRSEVKDSRDRYANMEVAYLLQRMEAYPGLSILTTNLKNSIDQAFLRRIRFIIQFPFPDVTQRAEIWRRSFPSHTPTEGLDPNKLAKLQVAGGNIRNIALNSAFIAAQAGQPIRMEHILQAAQSEYMKMERPLTDVEVKGWISS